MLNILLFNLLKGYKAGVPRRRLLAQAILILVMIAGPVAISLIRFYTYQENPDPKTVVVIQPNIDPYEKFVSIPSLDQTRIQLSEAARVADSSVDYFIAPETSINNNIWMEQIEKVPDIMMIRDFLLNYPGAAYVPGIQCYKRYVPGDTLSDNVRDIGNRYEVRSFNAAIQLDSTPRMPFYFKSKLVVGVEKCLCRYLRFLEKFTVRLGGTFRGWEPGLQGVFLSK
jgi:apolipoprotein N-acyltransferase